MVPELNGNPNVLTIKTSVFPKSDMVNGNSILKINNKMATTTMLAMMKFLTVMVL
jgi:hypothetical protein